MFFWSENQPGFAYMIRPRSSGSLGRKQPPSTLKPSLATRTAHVECISSALGSSVCRKRGLYNSIFCTYVFTKYAHLYINISTYQSFNISIYQHINISIYRYIDISIYQYIKISIYQYINISILICTYINIQLYIYTVKYIQLNIYSYIYILCTRRPGVPPRGLSWDQLLRGCLGFHLDFIWGS